MKLKMALLVVAIGMLLTTGYAAAENAEQTKKETCNAEATQKGLKGTYRDAFMSTCLLSGEPVAINPQQGKMNACNEDATGKGLEGAARDAFMKACLSAN